MFGGFRSHTMTRDQQIQSLRDHNKYCQQVSGSQSEWDMGLRLASGQTITVRISLPPAFPRTPPIIQIMQRVVRHPWIDASQRVVSSPELNSWTPSKNLGAVVKSVVDYLSTYPPVYTPESSPAPGGYGPAYPGAGRGYPPPPRYGPVPAAPGAMPWQGPPSSGPMPASSGPMSGYPPSSGPMSGYPPSSGPMGQPPPGYHGAGFPAPGSHAPPSASSSIPSPSSGPPSYSASTPAASAASSSMGSSAGAGSGAGMGSESAALHFRTPDVPFEFPELNALSKSELKHLLSNNQALKDFMMNLDIVKTYLELLLDAKRQNVSIARSTLDKEGELEAARGEIDILRVTIATRKAEYEALKKRYQAAVMRYSSPSLSHDLARSAADVNQRSEADMLAVMEGRSDTPPRDALAAYIKNRQDYHRMAAKADIIKSLGAEGASHA